ncbi:hypothetical protein PT974_05948 [Cladobotryum mycophilum]|uniref:Uncharacterized protein n=1 Tax=Cladobotryum mycophilum TaxID=491253 RepID=A0ABR0SKW9_9HYPO
MHHSKGIKLHEEQNKTKSWRCCKISPASWPSRVLLPMKDWFTMCLGRRESTASKAGRLEKEIYADEEEDEPLLEEEIEKPTTAKPFPRYAAAAFLRTGTSRAIREANRIL